MNQRLFIHRPLNPRVNLYLNDAGKMAVKYAFNIIFLKRIFKFMIKQLKVRQLQTKS